MLCQNCKKNEATTHIKRIINGAAQEYHLCRTCAENLGYSVPFASPFSDLFGAFLGDVPVSRLSNAVLRCETCGCTFEDIVNSGRVGCADCYRLFYDKLLPSVQRIHGKTRHTGKKPGGNRAGRRSASQLAEAKEQLKQAVAQQDFERAAALRDEIRQWEEKENG